LEISIDWRKMIHVIKTAVYALDQNDYSQPVKPYLRYKKPQNRIIAMPAYVGADINMAGIKWIASFPDNNQNNLPRAHSTVVLNDADSGVPVAIINTALLSAIRTASVSGLFIIETMQAGKIGDHIVLGIIGWGPIGQYHYIICKELFGNHIAQTLVYDNRPAIYEHSDMFHDDPNLCFCNSWQEVFGASNLLITCTTSAERYIDAYPKNGMVLLNISLRDYKPEFFKYVKNSIIVDDWDEVCRENTDVEMFHKKYNLSKEDVQTLMDVSLRNGIEKFNTTDCIMFNPMGMAVFDIAIAHCFYHEALAAGIGTTLP